MSYWQSPEGRARRDYALDQFRTGTIVNFDDGDLDDMEVDEQFEKNLELMEGHLDIDALTHELMWEAFRAVRIELGANTPENAKHSRAVGSDSDDVSDFSLDDSDSESDYQPDYPGVIVAFTVPCLEQVPMRYSPETLVSLIPDKPEYDSLKQRVGVLRISRRFIPTLSNRRARAILFSRGVNLATAPRYEHRQVLPYPMRVKVPFGGKPVRVLGLVKDTKVVRLKTTGEYNSSKAFLRRHEKQVSRLVYNPSTNGFRLVVRSEPPKQPVKAEYPKKWISRIKPEHKKCWYFLRKRGRVYKSVHNPYGDEFD